MGFSIALLVNNLQYRLFKAWVTCLGVSPRYRLRGKLLNLDHMLSPHDILGTTEETDLRNFAEISPRLGNMGNENVTPHCYAPWDWRVAGDLPRHWGLYNCKWCSLVTRYHDQKEPRTRAVKHLPSINLGLSQECFKVHSQIRPRLDMNLAV